MPIDDLSAALDHQPLLIAGPCAFESPEQFASVAQKLPKLGIRFVRGGAFKPRTCPDSFQGLGLDGLRVMHQICLDHNLFLVSEVLDASDLEHAVPFIDVLQVGSRNMASYGLLKAMGKVAADAGKAVLLKRGFGAVLSEFLQAAEYLTRAGVQKILLCLRGIRTFEQMDSQMRNTPDLASILELKTRSPFPVLFDPSHATGRASFVAPIARAALCLGADGLMIECHPAPSKALSDREQQLTIDQLCRLVDEVKQDSFAQ